MSTAYDATVVAANTASEQSGSLDRYWFCERVAKAGLAGADDF